MLQPVSEVEELQFLGLLLGWLVYYNTYSIFGFFGRKKRVKVFLELSWLHLKTIFTPNSSWIVHVNHHWMWTQTPQQALHNQDRKLIYWDKYPTHTHTVREERRGEGDNERRVGGLMTSPTWGQLVCSCLCMWVILTNKHTHTHSRLEVEDLLSLCSSFL